MADRSGRGARSGWRAPQPPTTTATPSPEATAAQLDRFLELQEREIDLRVREADLRRREIDNTARFSEQALGAQLEDRERERRHRRSGQTTWLLFLGSLFLALLGAMVLMTYLGEVEFAHELLRVLAYALPAAVGGYYAGRHRDRPPAAEATA